jgi:hypothetical protein
VSQDTASPNAPSVTAASGSVYSLRSTYWYSTGSGVTFTSRAPTERAPRSPATTWTPPAPPPQPAP